MIRLIKHAIFIVVTIVVIHVTYRYLILRQEQKPMTWEEVGVGTRDAVDNTKKAVGKAKEKSGDAYDKIKDGYNKKDSTR